MTTIKQPDRSSIVERIQKIRMRLHLEKASGIPVRDKEAFLAFCLEQEVSEQYLLWKLPADSPTEWDGSGESAFKDAPFWDGKTNHAYDSD